VAVFLAWYLGKERKTGDKKAHVKEKERIKQTLFHRMWRRRWFFIPGMAVLLLLIITGIRAIHKQVKVKWAVEEVLPQIQDFIHDWQYPRAFELREQVKKYIPDDPEFRRLDSLITNEYTVITKPEGAEVWYKEYLQLEEEWKFLGTTPIEQVEMPTMTMYRWRLTKEGHDTVFAAETTLEDTLYRTLHEPGVIPEGMVFVEGLREETSVDFLSGSKHGFYIDKYEVTNQQYKAFLDNGGYENPEFWEHAFVQNGDTLSYEEAMNLFVDATGRPGPAGWEAGDYPDGQDDSPVNGISWYEAAAYAAFAGKVLPSVFHWRSAAGFYVFFYRHQLGSHLIPMSNMGSDGPAPVGSNQALSCFGTFDISGNVREWCYNRAPSGRIIQGGAWNDVSYMTTNISQLPPFDRSEKNGFRCAIYLEPENIPEETFQPFDLGEVRDYLTEEPVSDAEFELMKNLYRYDRTDLNSVIEEVDESGADWILERISYNAAYEDKRVIAYLFLPTSAPPPYQTIVYFPGGNANVTENIFDYGTTSRNLYYLLKNGRAVLFPIYQGTFERMGESCASSYIQSQERVECTIKWVKDLRRSIDYLETRDDIDISRLGYLGDSWGAGLGPLITSVEERLRVSILLRGGLATGYRFPEIDVFNYAGHVVIPTLMLNGKYDFSFPVETTVRPLVEMLSTPESDKKLVLTDTDHFIPTSVMIREVLDWLDSYLGPVSKTVQ
jgi:hypothetical protein